MRASRGGRAERDDEEEEEEGGEEREDEEEESWDALDRRFEALRRGRPGVRARSEEEGEVEGTPAQRPRLEAEVEEREEEVSAGASLVLTGFSISAGTSRLVRLQSFGTPDGGRMQDLGPSMTGAVSRLDGDGQVIINIVTTMIIMISKVNHH